MSVCHHYRRGIKACFVFLVECDLFNLLTFFILSVFCDKHRKRLQVIHFLSSLAHRRNFLTLFLVCAEEGNTVSFSEAHMTYITINNQNGSTWNFT